QGRPRRVVLLVDVSGSMAPYADALLRFAHAAVRARPSSTEVFTIGTRLTRVTREMRLRDPDKALAASGSAIPDWSGGTRLGEVLKAFLDRWGQRGTARGAVVVVCSDGWERGGTELLAEQMVRLRRLAQDVVATGAPTLERYGVSDDDAFAVGLTCGGILDVFVESISRESFPELGEIADSVGRHEPVAVVTVVKGPDDRLGRRLVLWPDRASGTFGLQRLDDAVTADARGMLAAGRTGLLHVGHDGERRGDDLTL